MSKLLLRNVFIGGVGVVAASAGAMAPDSSPPAQPAEYPDAALVRKAIASNGWRETSAGNSHEGSGRHATNIHDYARGTDAT